MVGLSLSVNWLRLVVLYRLKMLHFGLDLLNRNNYPLFIYKI